MKVLILSSKLPYPPKDGGAIATLSLATGLADTGIELTMLTFNTRKHYFPPENIPEEITKSIILHTIDTDTATKPLKAIINLLFSGKPYIAQRFFNRQFSTKLTELLTEKNYDIVQMEGPYFAQYLPLIRKYSNATVALRAHNIEHEIWNGRWKHERNPLAKIYLRNLTKRIRKLEMKLLKDIDMIIPISERDENILLKLNPGLKSITIPTGINLSEYITESIGSNQDIFFIGALDWVPNQEGLIWFMKEVLPHLSENKQPAEIHIAGRNAPPELIASLTHPLVKYHGEVDDAKEFMNSHGIMIVPLLSGSGIRIKILEGMALGKCIVSTSLGAAGIPAENGKHLLLGDDGKNFAEHILTLLHNKELARTISNEANKLIQEKFDTFAIASKLEDFYSRMV